MRSWLTYAADLSIPRTTDQLVNRVCVLRRPKGPPHTRYQKWTVCLYTNTKGNWRTQQSLNGVQLKTEEIFISTRIDLWFHEQLRPTISDAIDKNIICRILSVHPGRNPRNSYWLASKWVCWNVSLIIVIDIRIIGPLLRLIASPLLLQVQDDKNRF